MHQVLKELLCKYNSDLAKVNTYTNSSTYVSSYTISYIKVSKLIFWEITFKPRQDITASTGSAEVPDVFNSIINMSTGVVGEELNLFINASVRITNAYWVSIGQLTANKSYYSSGVAICS